MCDDQCECALLDARFNTPVRYGVLLVLEGAPQHTSLWSVLIFLSRKLVNPRFYDFLPRWLWYPLVYAVMLPCIARDHQKMYASTWIRPRPRSSGASSSIKTATPCDTVDNADGEAAAVVAARQLAALLESCLRQQVTKNRPDVSVQVEVAFYLRRGSVESALERLHLRGFYGRDARDSAGAPIVVESDRLIVLPLYPHHKAEVTGTAWDAVMRSAYFQRHHSVPDVHFIRSYAEREVYVEAWHRHIRRYMGQHGVPDWLVIAFHGTRKFVATNSDTYREEYTRTVDELRERLSTPLSRSTPNPAPEDGLYFRGALPPSRVITGFLGQGSEELKEPRLEKVFLSIIRQLKSISANNSVTSTPLTSTLRREATGLVSPDGGVSSFQPAGSPARPSLPADMAPTAFVVCPGEALDDVATLYKLQRSLFSDVRRLGWKDVQYIPALNATTEHAELLSAVLAPHIL